MGFLKRVRSVLFGEAVSIDRLEVVPYALPFIEPYVTARGELSQRELVLVRLHCAGAIGLGEAVPMSLRGGTSLERIVDDLESRCRPLLEDAVLSPNYFDHLEACAAAGASTQTLAAVELALFDLYGKQLGWPNWRLLADIVEDVKASPVPCNATLSAGKPQRLAEQATQWAERGFSTFKVKVGTIDDLAKVTAVRDAVGDQARIRVDANGVWDEAQAAEKLHELESLQIELAEQPVGTLEAMAGVREGTGIPIAADESVNTLDDARRAALLGSCDLATVKLAKVGSLHVAFDIANELPVYLSSALDGPVGIAAAAHVAQALPRTGIASQLAQGLATAELFSGTIAARECTIAGGELQLSEGPGWGVEIDEAELERRRL